MLIDIQKEWNVHFGCNNKLNFSQCLREMKELRTHSKGGYFPSCFKHFYLPKKNYIKLL